MNRVKYVVGVDASYSNERIFGVAALIDYRSGLVLKSSIVEREAAIPYVPGFLAFREAPAYFSAIRKLELDPDVVFVNGHGLSHPRALGIATHIGLVIDKPTIGVAKRKLYGSEVLVNGEVYVKAHDHVVAKVVEHRGSKLYVSVGYKIRLEDAVEMVKSMLRPQYRLPLPLEVADRLSKEAAKKMK